MEMKVITSYPVVMKGEIPMESYDKPMETFSAGDLKVETAYPVILDGTDVSPKSYYSNVTGPTPSMEEQVNMKNKGLFWDRAKNTWQRISNSPASQYALQSLADYLAMKQAGTLGQQNVPTTPVTPVVETPPRPSGMSRNAKIALWVGGIAVVGIIAYSMFAKKN